MEGGVRTAIRLSFSYEGERVSLESRQDVDMAALPSDTEGEGGPDGERVAQLGVRLELVDAEGRVLYHRVSRHLIPESIEVPTRDPERPVTRQYVGLTKGSVDVVVPVIEGARELIFYRSPPEEAVRTGQAEPIFTEVLRVPLTAPD